MKSHLIFSPRARAGRVVRTLLANLSRCVDAIPPWTGALMAVMLFLAGYDAMTAR